MNRLHSLSYKTLFTILFLALAGIVFFLKIGGKTQKVSAAWWDDMWHYRKAINITNSSGSNLTDFQVAVSIGTSQLIADGKMQSDCDDIRITDINGNLLPHWIETNGLNACNQTNSVVWVKTASLPISGSTIYIYYGNPSASSISNGNNVFIFFDDFNNPTIDTNKWDLSGNMISISNNRLRSDRANGTGSLFSKTTYTRPFILDIDFFPTQYPAGWEGSYHGSTSFGTFDGSKNYEHAWTPYGGGGNSYCGFCDDGGCYHGQYVNPLVTGDTLYKISMQAQTLQSGPQGVMTYSNRKDDGTGSQVSGTIYTGATTGADPLYIGVKDYGSNITDDFEWDNWRIRKYAPSEPTSSPQPEETGTAPIAYWKLDEGSGTIINDSINSNTSGTFGVGNSAPTWASEAECISSKCLNFDGVTQYANTNQDFNWSISDSFSINFWIKPSSITGNQGVIGKGQAGGYGSQNWDWSVRLTGNSLSFFYWSSSGGAELTLSSSVTLNQWDFFSIIYDPVNKAQMYKNGKLVSSDTSIVNEFQNRATPILLGHAYYNGGVNSFFNGLLDEVKLYPYARTADQIKQDYNSRGSSSGAGVNLGVQSNTGPSIKSSLIGYWKLDENNGTKIFNSGSLGSALNGDFGTSAPTWTNNGKIGKALTFNNKKYTVITNDNNLIYNQNGFTYSAWIKGSSFTSSYNMFMGQYLPYFDVYNNGSTNRLHMSMNAGGSQRVVNGTTNMTTNRWYHVVATYDSQGYMKVYLDGKLDGTAGPYLTPTVGNQNFYLGTWGSGLTYPFDGDIDEVKIYNRALTAEEVKQDYNQGSAIQFGTTSQNIGGTTTSLDYCVPGDTSYCASPVAEWNFEENTGTVVKDTSGNNNNGTFGTGNSAPTWALGANNKGSGLKFDGTNNYASAALNGTSFSDFSYELWFKTNSISGNAGILQWANTLSAGSPMVYIDRYNSNIRIYNSGTYSSSIPINPNTWYQLSAVYSAGTTKTDVYLNGVLKTTLNKQLTLQSQGVTMYFGNGYNGYFDGSIDDVKIYNYARTPAQIAYDYNRGAPVGWWKFDECQGSTAHDSSGNNNHGTITIGSNGIQNSLGTCQTGTSAAWTNGASGKINSSLNFDGVDDKITINDSSSLDITGPISISFWIKGLSSNSVTRGIIEKSNNSSFFGSYPNVSYQIGELNNNKVRFLFNNGVSDANTGQVSTNKTDWDVNTWYQITATWDGSTNTNGIKIYINGTINNQATSPITAIQNTSGTLNIAGKGTNYNFNGQIDDVRIYNYALTSEQVKTVYNNGAVNFQ